MRSSEGRYPGDGPLDRWALSHSRGRERAAWRCALILTGSQPYRCGTRNLQALRQVADTQSLCLYLNLARDQSAVQLCQMLRRLRYQGCGKECASTARTCGRLCTRADSKSTLVFLAILLTTSACLHERDVLTGTKTPSERAGLRRKR